MPENVEAALREVRTHLEDEGELVYADHHGRRVAAFLLDYNAQDRPRYCVVEENGDAAPDRGKVAQGLWGLFALLAEYGNPEDWRLEGGRGG